MNNDNKPLIRFKGFTDAWKQEKLGNILIPGSKSPVLDKNKYKRITVKLNKQGITESVSVRKLSDSRPFYIRNKGEIIIGKQNYFNGSISLVPDEYDGYICSNAIMSFKVSENSKNEFVYYSISGDEFLNRRKIYANGTGQKELSEKDFLNFKIFAPTIKEQVSISKFHQLVQMNITFHQRKLDELKNLKKTMLNFMFPKEGQDKPDVRFKGFTDALGTAGVERLY